MVLTAELERLQKMVQDLRLSQLQQKQPVQVDMQTYNIRIVREDRQTGVAQRVRKGSFSPRSLKQNLKEENAEWVGVLVEQSDPEAGLAGDNWQLPGGSYTLIIGTSAGACPPASPISQPVHSIGGKGRALNDGIRMRRDLGLLAKRAETTKALLEWVQLSKVIQIPGPAASGKSGLCHLLLERASHSDVFGQHVYLIDCATVSPHPQTDKFQDAFAQAVEGKYSFKEVCAEIPCLSAETDADDPPTSPGPAKPSKPAAYPKKKLLIVDECQRLYDNGTGSEVFWGTVKQIALGCSNSLLHIIIATSRSSSPSLDPIYGPSPDDLQPTETVPLRASNGAGCLSFTEGDFLEAWHLVLWRLQLGSGELRQIRKVIRARADLHVGCSNMLFDLVREQYKPGPNLADWEADLVQHLLGVPDLALLMAGKGGLPQHSFQLAGRYAQHLVALFSNKVQLTNRELRQHDDRYSTDISATAEEWSQWGWLAVEQGILEENSPLRPLSIGNFS